MLQFDACLIPGVSYHQLELNPKQYQLVEQAVSLIKEGERAIINASGTGSGKSYMTLGMALELKRPLFIVCQKHIAGKWDRLCQAYGVSYHTIISYQSLAGTSPKLNHPWLTRTDVASGKSRIITTYQVTDSFLRLAHQGVLLVFDEFQHIKNPNITSRACHCLSRVITLHPTSTSYLVAMSASPFDHEKHANMLLKLIGYIDSSAPRPRMKHPPPATLREGLEPLIEKARLIDPPATDALSLSNLTLKTINAVCYQLYLIIKRRIVLGIYEIRLPSDVTVTMRNGFYRIDSKYASQLQLAITELAASSRYHNGTASFQEHNAVEQALMDIEFTKIHDMAERAFQILRHHPHHKVVLSLNYNRSIDQMFSLLEQYHPLIINGSVDPALRDERLELYNAPTPAYRVLIMNSKVGTGFDLHDTIGGFPRHMFISPSYSILSLIQVVGRCFREGTKSNVTITIFYGDGKSEVEIRILEALARKTEYVQGSIPEEAARYMVFPGSYPCFREDSTGELVPMENPISASPPSPPSSTRSGDPPAVPRPPEAVSSIIVDCPLTRHLNKIMLARNGGVLERVR